MSAHTAIRIATPGSGGKATAGAPGGEGRGFPAALTAAGSGSRATGDSSSDPGGNGVTHDKGVDDERDARAEASDPALAAALAAQFPGIPQTPAGGEGAAEDMDAQLLAISARIRAGGSGGDGGLDAQLDGALDAQLAAMGDELDPATGKDLLQNLARQLALARDTAALRAGTDARVPLSGEALPASAATHAATQLAGMSATVIAAATAEQALRLPVGAPRWADELGSRLVHMSMRGQHEGSLTLAPEHLGPLEVRISMSQNTAHVWFGAQHADARAALAEALPRLREMLADAGLSLGHASVSQEAPGQEAGRPMPLQRPPDAADATQETATSPDPQRPVSGLLDLYA